MNLADVFIKLGITGADKTKKELEGISSGLGSIGESSLAAKAAVLGVIIGLERLTGFASQRGADLKNYATLTGMATDELQNFQHALGKFGVSNDETADTLKNLQAAMAKMRITGATPGGLPFISDWLRANKMGAIDLKKAMDQKTGAGYLMLKVQQFMKGYGKINPAYANEMAKTLPFADKMLVAMRLMNLERDKPRKQDLITEEEQERLFKINMIWKEIWFTLQTIGTKFIAAHGLFFVEELLGAIQFIQRAVSGVVTLTDKFHGLGTALKVIGGLFALYFFPIPTLIAGIIGILSDAEKFITGKDSVIGKLFNSPVFKKIQDTIGDFALGDLKGDKNPGGSIASIISPAMADTQSPTQNSELNVTNVFDIKGGLDQKAADSINDNINATLREQNARSGGF